MIEGIHSYENFTFGTKFLGTQALLAKGTNDILCYDWFYECNNYEFEDTEVYSNVNLPVLVEVV